MRQQLADQKYFERVINMMTAWHFAVVFCHREESENKNGDSSQHAVCYTKVTSLIFRHRSTGLHLVLRYTEKVVSNGHYSARWSLELDKEKVVRLDPQFCTCQGFVVASLPAGSAPQKIQLVQQGESDDVYSRYYPSMLACAARELAAKVRHAPPG